MKHPTGIRRHLRWWRGIVSTGVAAGLLCALTVLLVGCGSDSDDSQATSDRGEASVAEAPMDALAFPTTTHLSVDVQNHYSADADAAAFDMAAEGSEALVPEPVSETDSATFAEESAGSASSGESTALAVPTALTPADIGRDIIYTASITVESEDVATASDEAVRIVESLGGLVFSQNTRTEPTPITTITFKVLPADFSTALERLAGVGDLVDQSLSADDVTERVVDLESRIITSEASVVRLRNFLDTAARLEDVARLERELLDRETRLETLRGQLRTLRSQVDLATITMRIEQSPTVLPDTGMQVSLWASDDTDGDACLGETHVEAEPDSTIHFCLEIENTGAAALTDVTLRSRDIVVDSFQASQQLGEGGFNRIEPSELLVAQLEQSVIDSRLHGRVATRGLEIIVRVEAVPVDADGNALAKLSRATSVFVVVHEDESLPGFGESVGSGVDFLRAVGSRILIVVGVMLPLLPFLAVFGLVAWWLLRGRRRNGSPRGRTSSADVDASASEPAADTDSLGL